MQVVRFARFVRSFVWLEGHVEMDSTQTQRTKLIRAIKQEHPECRADALFLSLSLPLHQVILIYLLLLISSHTFLCSEFRTHTHNPRNVRSVPFLIHAQSASGKTNNLNNWSVPAISHRITFQQLFAQYNAHRYGNMLDVFRCDTFCAVSVVMAVTTAFCDDTNRNE